MLAFTLTDKILRETFLLTRAKGIYSFGNEKIISFMIGKNFGFAFLEFSELKNVHLTLIKCLNLNFYLRIFGGIS